MTIEKEYIGTPGFLNQEGKNALLDVLTVFIYATSLDYDMVSVTVEESELLLSTLNKIRERVIKGYEVLEQINLQFDNSNSN